MRRSQIRKSAVSPMSPGYSGQSFASDCFVDVVGYGPQIRQQLEEILSLGGILCVLTAAHRYVELTLQQPKDSIRALAPSACAYPRGKDFIYREHVQTVVTRALAAA